MLTKDELRDLLKLKIIENKGKIPQTLVIENEEWQWAGGQRIGNGQLFKYRKSGVFVDRNVPEKLIMLAGV